jgi:phospho-N-acetylmuramoyl-pentapeptide-transferase
MTALAAAGLLSLAVALAAGRPLIVLLRRLSYHQQAYDDAPASHQVKTGTPTMGGLLFLAAPLIAALLVRDGPTTAYAFLILGSAAVGALDDVAAIQRGRNRGLNARTKFLATAVVGAAFLWWITALGPVDTSLLFVGPVPLWLWYALSLAAILATTHAVNLTDGLDGLAGGTIVPPLLVLGYVALRRGDLGTATMEAAVLGAVLGFLAFNRHPASLFMGDTGSLGLGAALAGGAILSGAQLLLPLVGGVFAAETLSVIVQVASYKTTRRRVFRMSPLHHHFELGGWPETKVTSRFWLASLVLGIIGFVIVVRA